MKQPIKVLLVVCLVGTCIAIVGAVLRTSNIQEREELGVLIHRGGMTVMLIGFGGLFLIRQNRAKLRKKSAFSWSDVDGKLTVKPALHEEILNISVPDGAGTSIPMLESLELIGVRCLIARRNTIDKDLVARFVTLQQLQVMDLQNATLREGVIEELELLESLELILLAGCLEPAQTKQLRMALPELKMIFDPR